MITTISLIAGIALLYFILPAEIFGIIIAAAILTILSVAAANVRHVLAVLRERGFTPDQMPSRTGEMREGVRARGRIHEHGMNTIGTDIEEIGGLKVVKPQKVKFVARLSEDLIRLR